MKTIIKHSKAIISIALILMLSSGTVWPAPSWQQQRHGAVSFSIGTKGYLGTGYGYVKNVNAYKKDFWEYNPATDSWTQKADFGGTARWCAVGFSIGTKGYIGTGSIGNEKTKDFWEYNPTTNTWTQKADLGGVERVCAVGFSIGTKGYLGTGYRYVDNVLINLQDFWEYDPGTDTWIQVADFPELRYAAVGFSIGAKGYVGTGLQMVGSDEYIWYNDFYEYDPVTDLWTTKAPLGGNTRGFAAGFSISTKGYIGTGNSTAGFLKDFWEYNPGNDTWLQRADFGGDQRDCATGFGIGTKGYLGTGLKAANVFSQDFWEYNPGTNTWTRKTDLGSKHKGPMKEADAVIETGQDGEIAMAVFPNPSSSNFNFIFKTNNREPITLQLFDISGRLIQEYQSLSPDNIITIGENLESGVYMAIVTQGTLRKSIRIAKVN
jgi:N-acetylneuraminic acid mutarotase